MPRGVEPAGELGQHELERDAQEERQFRAGQRLRALREQRGMTQEHLAARAEISVVEPSLFTVLAIVRVLGASIEDVVT